MWPAYVSLALIGVAVARARDRAALLLSWPGRRRLVLVRLLSRAPAADPLRRAAVQACAAITAAGIGKLMKPLRIVAADAVLGWVGCSRRPSTTRADDRGIAARCREPDRRQAVTSTCAPTGIAPRS